MVKANHALSNSAQFITPSLYNQITQLIFITDIFTPRILKMYHAFWRHAFLVRGHSFSVKIFNRSRSSCEVIRLRGGETFFVGLPGRLSLSPRVSPSRALVLSCDHYFQASATQATVKWPIERDRCCYGNR